MGAVGTSILKITNFRNLHRTYTTLIAPSPWVDQVVSTAPSGARERWQFLWNRIRLTATIMRGNIFQNEFIRRG